LEILVFQISNPNKGCGRGSRPGNGPDNYSFQLRFRNCHLPSPAGTIVKQELF
jgi:hypothetical protein